ncbi:MAG: hypothetical protein HXS48_14295 [Theionarchaea archaeon]|nr:MAG: hypothetical protein AYK19_12245 [Theionarchaea archaeon DG-70-1]MBU7028100.1 hypothetical protein [Theionarchaea archaeon]
MAGDRLPVSDSRDIEQEFINSMSNEFIEAIVELGFPKIRNYRENIKNAMYSIIKRHMKTFGLRETPGTLKKILLILSDIILGFIIYFTSILFDKTTIEKVRVFGHEFGVFYVFLVLIVLILLYVHTRLSLKKY